MKVTIEGIKAKIKSESYLVLPDGRTTLCMLTLENGYTIKGLSACVDASEFNMDIGRKIAYEDAIRQIWPLEGYLLAEKIHLQNMIVDAESLASEPSIPKLTTKKSPKLPSNFLPPKRLKALVDAGLWSHKNAKKLVHMEKENAPYGWKQDGTPAKKRGRKTA